MRSSQKQFLMIAGTTFLIVVVIGLLIVVLLVGNINPAISTSSSGMDVHQASAEVPENRNVMFSMFSGETVMIEPGDVLLFIPAGTFNETGTVRISQLDVGSVARGAMEGWENLQVVNLEFQTGQGQILPGLTLNRNIEICFVMDNNLWQQHQSGAAVYRVHYLSESDSQWSELPLREYPDRQQLCGLSSHLSIFALAKQLPATATPRETSAPTLYGTP